MGSWRDVPITHLSLEGELASYGLVSPTNRGTCLRFGVKILDFAGLFRPIVGAVIGSKWKILGVTSSGPREVFVDVEEANNKP